MNITILYGKNVGIKIKIGCKIHGIFEQSPSNHLMGKGCPYCSGVGRMTKNIFIKKAIKIHKDKYKYDNIADGFLITKNNVEIECNKHGIFKQNIYNHLKGYGCPNCAINAKITNEKFLERSKKIHGDKYDYSNVEYIHITKPVKIICKVHGEFEQTPSNHLTKYNCQKCAKNFKLDTLGFIEKAKEVHKDIYDFISKSLLNALNESL